MHSSIASSLSLPLHLSFNLIFEPQKECSKYKKSILLSKYFERVYRHCNSLKKAVVEFEGLKSNATIC